MHPDAARQVRALVRVGATRCEARTGYVGDATDAVRQHGRSGAVRVAVCSISLRERPEGQGIGVASKADLIVELALAEDGLELFRTSGHDGYVRLPAGNHREVWPIRSRAFRRWLSLIYFRQQEGAPGGQTLTDALGVLEGLALFDGEEHQVHLRLADHEGDIYLDLADADWRAIRIGSERMGSRR